jgi:hypothetical protein
METVLWDRIVEMLINELMQQRTTITLEVDCETLKKLP